MQPDDLAKKFDELSKRVQALEDLEEIKKLKVRYAKYCDDRYNPEKLANLFTEDAVLDAAAFGQYQGRKEIRDYFANISRKIVFAVHRIVAPDITVEGDKAWGTWYGMTTALSHKKEGFWLNSMYTDEYRKVNGQWLISSQKVHQFFRAPYEGGWAKNMSWKLD